MHKKPNETPILPPYSNRHLLIILGFLLLLTASAWAFYPGLGGSLLFDDIPNLKPWADLGDINTQSKILSFISSSQFFPGRPLSLLSFLIDDQSWPADIVNLKRTNLGLHLINSCLIFWLCLKIISKLLPQKDHQAQALLSLIATAIWSLHPLQVSNVSYIIQRMNLLSTALELTGLLIFIYGREQLEKLPGKTFLLCSISIAVFMPLAVLAKENGLLLCAFALLIENFCFPPTSQKWWRIWKLSFLWLPLIIFLIYCLIIFHGFTIGFSARNFNAWERLLTQGPVLIDYLSKLFLPRLHGSGLFFDNFPISHSLLNPVSTLFCWAIIFTALALAWTQRRKQALISFGIFFYFCGHLLESTILPLELYYEHRNYLPQIGLWLALIGFSSLTERKYFQRILLIACTIVLILLLVLTRMNSALWSQPDVQAAVWYYENPSSVRTSLSYAHSLTIKRNFTGAYEVLEKGRRHNPKSLSLLLSQRYIKCYAQDTPTNFDDLPAFASHADFENGAIITLEKIRTLYESNDYQTKKNQKCSRANDTQIAAIYTGMLKNKAYRASSNHPLLLQYLAEISSAHDDPMSLYYYDEAFKVQANPIYPYRQAILLSTHSRPQLALRHIEIAKKSLTKHYQRQYPDLLRRLEQLQNSITHQSKGQ